MRPDEVPAELVAMARNAARFAVGDLFEAANAVAGARTDERDALKAAVQHLAAEAHRRKWAHEHSSLATFLELHRLGNELLAALKAPESHEDAEEGDQWRRDEREIDGGFSGCEFPRLWPPRRAPESPAAASAAVSAATEAHGGAGEAQEG
jgi:hypothetical protein